jgi:hypothetical protein
MRKTGCKRTGKRGSERSAELVSIRHCWRLGNDSLAVKNGYVLASRWYSGHETHLEVFEETACGLRRGVSVPIQAPCPQQSDYHPPYRKAIIPIHSPAFGER